MPPFGNQFHINLEAGNGGGLLPFLFVVVFAIWLGVLISLLKREDLKDADKIVWVVVLCTLNVLGMLLYWFLAPSEPRRASSARSEKELKDYFNSRGGTGPNQPD